MLVNGFPPELRSAEGLSGCNGDPLQYMFDTCQAHNTPLGYIDRTVIDDTDSPNQVSYPVQASSA
jgi:hypothetical protein